MSVYQKFASSKTIKKYLIALFFLLPPSSGSFSDRVFLSSSLYAEQTSQPTGGENGTENPSIPEEKEKFNRGTFVGKENGEREKAAQKLRARNWLIAITTVVLGIVTLVLVSKHHHNS